ncbi:MAG: hypothetical protein HWN66_05815 [Candidatus Helarchaeota archaeon]|nr:hypothetical protein [Candidatus Helarchaeota archaeon]
MGAAKAIGGLLVFVAGVLVLLIALDFLNILEIFTSANPEYIDNIMYYSYVWPAAGPNYPYIGLILAIFAIIGGILGMAGKKAGGAIALLIGALWFIGGFLLASVPILFPMSAIFFWTDQITIPNGLIAIEAIICLLGSSLILASRED